jgi:hypothetical protein
MGVQYNKKTELSFCKLVIQRHCLVRKNFQDFPSHQIFGRMHEALNIDKNKN